MYPRTKYKMTEADMEKILDACKPVPMIMLNIGAPSSPQENANRAWAELGQRMGFDAMTVRPVEGEGSLVFTAVPSETESQRIGRLEREELEAKRENIERLKTEIGVLQDKLTELLK